MEMLYFMATYKVNWDGFCLRNHIMIYVCDPDKK